MRKKPLHMLLSACLALTVVLPACSGGNKNQQQQDVRRTTQTETNTTIQTNGILGDGLDLSRLPSLVKEAKNGEELEEILNTSGVNNLDTNNDGKTDYLNVEEVRENGSNGFVLFTNENNDRIDIAKIDVTKTQQTADVAVSGNPQYYGNQPVVYRSSFGLTEMLLVAWMFDLSRPRFYHAPYYHGRYPGYYKSYYKGGYAPVASRAVYKSRVSSGNFSVKGKPLVAGASRRGTGSSSSFGSSAGSSSRRMTGGSSFSTTTNKRPFSGGSTSTRGSTGSSTTSRGSFGSSSNRSKPSFSFGNSNSGSSRSSVGSSSSSRSRSSFGGSSSRRRR